MLELVVKVININLSEEHPILKECRPIYEYSWLIERIKEKTAAGLIRDDAIIGAILEAKKEGILEEFLSEYGTEVLNMIYTQFNLEDALEVRGEEKFLEGEAIGETRGEAKGKYKGEVLKLISQVRKKQQKGFTAESIAEIFEEDSESINSIFKAIVDNPAYSDDKLLQEMENRYQSVTHEVN